MLQRVSQAAIIIAPLVAVGVAAFVAGRRSSRWARRAGGPGADQMRDRVTVCECGAQLHGTTANDMEYHLRSRRHATNMRLVGLQGSLVIRVTENFAEYRHCIEHCVAAEDTVVEMGCGRGVTTDLLARRCSRAVGIDASAKVIEMARSRFPHVTFATGAAEDISGIRALGDFSVLFLDINGSRELATLVPLLERYESALGSHGLRLIVVKSTRLKRLLLKSRCVQGEHDDAEIRLGERESPKDNWLGDVEIGT